MTNLHPSEGSIKDADGTGDDNKKPKVDIGERTEGQTWRIENNCQVHNHHQRKDQRCRRSCAWREAVKQELRRDVTTEKSKGIYR